MIRWGQQTQLMRIDTADPHPWVSSTTVARTPPPPRSSARPVCSKSNAPPGAFDPQHLEPGQTNAITHGGESSRWDYGMNTEGYPTPSAKDSAAVEDDLNHPSRRIGRDLKTTANVAATVSPWRFVRWGAIAYNVLRDVLNADDPSAAAGNAAVGFAFSALLGGILGVAGHQMVGDRVTPLTEPRGPISGARRRRSIRSGPGGRKTWTTTGLQLTGESRGAGPRSRATVC